jgi:hypothetical protein
VYVKNWVSDNCPYGRTAKHYWFARSRIVDSGLKLFFEPQTLIDTVFAAYFYGNIWGNVRNDPEEKCFLVCCPPIFSHIRYRLSFSASGYGREPVARSERYS